MTIIDAHHHVWDLSVRDQSWISGPDLAPLRRDFTIADLEPVAAAAGVTAAILVQTITVPEETPEFLAMAAASPLIAGVVGWVDLTAPDVGDRLAELWSADGGASLVGIRHQVQAESDPDWLTRPNVLRGLATVADAGLAYDLLVLPHQLPAATRAAAMVPGLTFVLDHLGKPPIADGDTEPWASAVSELASLPNTVCKLSGMVTEADWGKWTVDDLRPYFDVVLDAFGPDRLMFGSDWPVSTLAASYAEVVAAAGELTANLSQSEQAAIFAGTATRVYQLQGRP
ncbi:MAG TPA: amidohydrolase family protein [Actinokineospora sp.]|jgi:L-fuconolactonase|nr:amidohydrolase family protein [Actinokineospora sp.]